MASDLIHFLKMQALGNDLILIPALDLPDLDWPALAQAMCPRNFAVGADGMLVLQRSREADFRMRMFNPDGTEDMCGNGLRCVTYYLHSQGLIPRGSAALETLDGIKTARVIREGPQTLVEVEMGPPHFKPAEMPMLVEGERVLDYPLDLGDVTVRVTAVSMGTPHMIIFTPQPVDDATYFTLGPRLENHSLFPERTNVTWCVVEARDRIRPRFWERAVGESLSCGTGACAALVAARLHSLVDDEVRVLLQHGELKVRWDGTGSVYKTGPAEVVFTGVWPLPSP